MAPRFLFKAIQHDLESRNNALIRVQWIWSHQLAAAPGLGKPCLIFRVISENKLGLRLIRIYGYELLGWPRLKRLAHGRRHVHWEAVL
jgi:hypothetical protein